MGAGAHFLSAVSAGKRRRASRVVGSDGRCVLVAMDHPAYMGTGVPAEAIEPIDPDSDLRTKVSFMLDDRRRLEDRIALLETGWTHSQQPVSRVCRQVSNVAAWPLEPNTTEVDVRCSVVAWEYRRDSVTPFVSRNDYILRDLEGDWTIARKIVSLVNSRGDVRKFPFIL